MQRRILTESRRQSVGSKARRTHAWTFQHFPQPAEFFSLELLSRLSLGLLNLLNVFLELLSPLLLGFLSYLNPSFSLLNISLAVLVP